MLSRLNQTTKRLIIVTTAFVLCVIAVAFLNYQSDDEIYFGAFDYVNVPEYADDSDGVITIDDTMGAKAGTVMAETPAIHVDKGAFILDIDQQNESDISIEIYDGARVIAETALPPDELNSKIYFSSDNNLYNLRICYKYDGEGRSTVKRSILYSVRRPFYSDTVIYALLIVIAACVLTAFMIKAGFFELPAGDKLWIASVVLYLILINYMYYRPFPLGVEDVGYHLARIEATYNEMRQGQMPIVMYSDFVQGRGMIGIMYPYLLLYIPAILRVLHMSPEGALRIFFILITCATCASSYFASKHLTKNRYIATAAMMLYGLLIYRIAAMTYRYAYGELQAFVFFPLVIWGLYEIVIGDRRKWPILALGMTGLLQSHLLSFIQATVLCIIFGILNIATIIKEKRMIPTILAALTTIALNLWYIVPFLMYYKEDLSISEHLSWGDNIYGYSSYLTEMLRLFPNTSEGESQHKIGLVGLWLVVLVAIAIYLQFRKKERGRRDNFSLVLILIGAFLMFMASKAFPWETAMKFESIKNSIEFIQFVGRFYMMGEICLFFGAIITLTDGVNISRPEVKVIMFAMILLASMQAYAITDNWMAKNTDPFCNVKEGRYTPAVNDTTVEDYVPEGYWFGEGFAEEVQSPTAHITDYEHDHLHTSFEYKTSEATYAEIPILYYKGYKATTDEGTMLAIEKGDAGCIRIELPRSEEATRVNVDFTGYTVWKISLLISILSAFLFIGCIIREFKGHSNVS